MTWGSEELVCLLSVCAVKVTLSHAIDVWEMEARSTAGVSGKVRVFVLIKRGRALTETESHFFISSPMCSRSDSFTPVMQQA